MVRKNARLFGYLVLLALVLGMMVYFNQQVKRPAPDPGREMNNLPELGHPPTPEQVRGATPPPKGK